MKTDWSIRNSEDRIDQAVKRYKRYLENRGFRPTTIRVYSSDLRRYLRFAGTDRPSEKDLKAFREGLFDRQVGRSTHNNYKFCITEYHRMLGEKVDIPFLPRNEILPYFFSEEEYEPTPEQTETVYVYNGVEYPDIVSANAARDADMRADEDEQELINNEGENTPFSESDWVAQHSIDTVRQSVQQVAPTAPDYVNKGIALDAQGKYDEAIQAFDKAIDINPQDADAWSNKGWALNNLGKYAEAIKACDKAIELNPQLAQAWGNKGIALLKLGRNTNANEAFAEAIEINPQYAKAWYNKGVALQKLGRNSEAQAAYDKAKELGYSG